MYYVQSARFSAYNETCLQAYMYIVYVGMLYYIHLGASTTATTHCARENFYLPAHSGGMHICICTYAMYTHRSVWMYSRKRKRGHFHNACQHTIRRVCGRISMRVFTMRTRLTAAIIESFAVHASVVGALLSRTCTRTCD